MPSSTSLSDISCENFNGIPYFGGGQEGFECADSQGGRPEIDHDKDAGDPDENGDGGVVDPIEYISNHHRDRDFLDKFDDRNSLVHNLLRLELHVVELESQLNLCRQARFDSMHEEKDDPFANQTFQQQQQLLSLQQENTILTRKLVSMHEELFTERINSMKTNSLLKDEINALKLELDWTAERNDSLLKTNLELKSMFRKNDKIKTKRRKSLEGELVCPFPTDNERFLCRVAIESHGSSIAAESSKSFDLVKVLRNTIIQPVESVLTSNIIRQTNTDSNEVFVPFPKETRRATVYRAPIVAPIQPVESVLTSNIIRQTNTDSNEVFVPFPKETRRATVYRAPIASKHVRFLDLVQSFLPRSRGGNIPSRNTSISASGINLDIGDYNFPLKQLDKGSGDLALHSLRNPEDEQVESHESWAPADEINTQTELFNFKSMAKNDRSYKPTIRST